MTTRRQQEQERYTRALLGQVAQPGYYTQPVQVTGGSTIVGKSTVVIPESSRKAGLGEK